MNSALFKTANPNLYPDATLTNASVVIQGNVLEYKVSNRHSLPVSGARGSITTFSQAARLRMLKHFHRINFNDNPEPLFLTLTYPDDVATPDLEERNTHRKVMARHLERITGAMIPAAWRVEWQKRKSGNMIGTICPHWHWLIFRHRWIDYKEINLAWRKTIGIHGYVRTDIRRVDKRGVVHMYMAKYISKEACNLSLVYAAYQNKLGRQYGWLRKSEIPLYDATRHHTLSDGDRDMLTRLAVERLAWVKQGLEQSFTLFGSVAEDARRILGGETLDGG